MQTWQTQTFRDLNTPLERFIGDKSAAPFNKLRIHTVGDLLRHVPRRYLSGTEGSELASLPIGEEAAVLARINSAQAEGQVPRRRLAVEVGDGSATMKLTFFDRVQKTANEKHKSLIPWWMTQLQVGRTGIFVGKVSSFNNELQMTHPKFVVIDERGEVIGKENKKEIATAVSRSGLVGFYPQASGLPTWRISSTVALVLDQLPNLVDPLPAWVRGETELPELMQALQDVHLPDTRAKAEAGIERLRFDEALALQLTMAYRRADARLSASPVLAGRAGGLLDQLDARLPFTLTHGQQAVNDEIFADMARPHPMQRLLQGEVGSGKTVVALRAMARAIDSGRQAVLLAPTEVLAAQHAESLHELLGDLGQGRTLGAPEAATEVALLTGSMSAAQKKAGLLKIASGEAGIVVGTHAVLADRVIFADLGLVVVDEQHRFGVEQRAALNDKAEMRPHVLVMTATPIPRTVAMTVFGDLETSTLRDIPSGRSDVQTTVVNPTTHPAWFDRAWTRVREEVAQGRQAFVVCSRISRTQTDEESAFTEQGLPEPVTVEEFAEHLATGPLAGLRLAPLHGRMTPAEKDEVMQAFATGRLDVIVSTTVVEVGVNVPNASVMVVMDADRFGISQLHQLRGRIGRGEHPGLCLLVSHAKADSVAAHRLAAVAATRDGFMLAEEDLAARREGNILGAAQAGPRSTLRLLRVLEHADTIAMARTIAERLAEEDPRLENPYLADMVHQTELLAAGEWLEKS